MEKANNLICTLLLLGFFQSINAQQQNVSFQDGVGGYDGTRDTWIDAAETGTNFGTDNELNVDGGGGTSNESTFIFWELTSIQPGNIITSVEITLNVTNTSNDTYEFYEMKRPWIESEATYNEYASGLIWQTPGANGSLDRGSTVLGSITPSITGLVTVTLNAAGVSMVQSWVDSPSTNLGFIIMNYSVTNGANFSSREETTYQPKITIDYTPPLTVTSPNGGEIWQVGSLHDITWNSAGMTSGTVDIDYSTDNGLNWINIVSSTDDNGTHPWTVPATSTSQALVRVRDTDTNGPSDTSDATFIITSAPTLIVTYPNGGESLEGGSVENITWSSLGTSGFVRIEFSADNGFSWSDIAFSTEDDGLELWVMPDTSTSQAVVRIRDADGNGPSDNSDGVFMITPPAPSMGESIIFSATGDVPYGSSEIPILQQQIADHNLYSSSEFFVHLGDIQSQSTSCPQSLYSSVAGYLMELAVPVFIVPGDNETTDCSNPAQAWTYWVQYFMDFELNFCGAPFAEKQSVRPENFAFVSKGVLFIGINLVSGASSSSVTDDADWVEQQLQDKVSQVRGAVIFSQAPPSEGSFDNRFLSDAQTFAKPVLFIHGDGHSWEYEYPYNVSNVLRVQVDNGGAEEPVQITATLDDQDPQQMFVFLRDPFSNNPQVYNVMPCVEAGSDQQIDFGFAAILQGKATDDGVPTSPGVISTTWSKISGPGMVTFNNPSDLATSASFSHAGNYVLRLTADDGDLQNYDEVSVDVRGALVEAKIFLEGPYDAGGDSMKTDLSDNSFVPTTSPYSEDPRMASGPIPTNITDWVLVELRETATSAAVASKSVLLRNDGKIFAHDGVTPTIVMDAGTNSYYIVVKHRNHLSVMSAGSVPLSSGSSTPYDFTTGIGQYYGASGAKEIESGVWGMWSGDIDQSLTVDANDRAASWNDRNKTGYFDSDCKLSGTVDANSRATTWNNRNRISTLP